MPVQVLSGADDTVIEPNAAAQWRELALGKYRHDSLPGGHFYTPKVWRTLPENIISINR
jgi:surfactin synthase thioesterase subunit